MNIIDPRQKCLLRYCSRRAQDTRLDITQHTAGTPIAATRDYVAYT